MVCMVAFPSQPVLSLRTPIAKEAPPPLASCDARHRAMASFMSQDAYSYFPQTHSIYEYYSQNPYTTLNSYPVAPRTPQPYPYGRPPLPARPVAERGTTYPSYVQQHHQHIPPPPPPPLPPRSPVYGDIPFVPPIVPDVPQSPTYSNASSHTYSTHSNDSGGPVAHWAMKIFDGRHSSTPFKTLAPKYVMNALGI